MDRAIYRLSLHHGWPLEQFLKMLYLQELERLGPTQVFRAASPSISLIIDYFNQFGGLEPWVPIIRESCSHDTPKALRKICKCFKLGVSSDLLDFLQFIQRTTSSTPWLAGSFLIFNLLIPKIIQSVDPFTHGLIPLVKALNLISSDPITLDPHLRKVHHQFQSAFHKLLKRKIPTWYIHQVPQPPEVVQQSLNQLGIP